MGWIEKLDQDERKICRLLSVIFCLTSENVGKVSIKL